MTRILITGGAGMVGLALADALPSRDIVVTDLARAGLPEQVSFQRMDVTGSDPDTIIAKVQPEVVVHLASIVTPPQGMTREQAFACVVHLPQFAMNNFVGANNAPAKGFADGLVTQTDTQQWYTFSRGGMG